MSPPRVDHAPQSPPGKPRRSIATRALWFALAVLVLAWTWKTAGLNESTKLWSNRERAADYILGQRVDESTIATHREEALRKVRTERQTLAREAIEAELKASGEPTPGLMALMRQAEQRASRELDALDPAELERLVQAKLDTLGRSGHRRGGYFPPETSPRAVFGNPDDIARVPPPLSWLVSWGEAVGLGRAARWTVAAIAGDGYTAKLIETLAIALWGTLLAVIISIPAALLASGRTLEIMLPGDGAGHRLARWTGRFVVRRSFDISRGFNEIVLAMIFVAVLGLGPLPGVLALLVHTYGVLGKVFSEAMETIDPKPIEGVQSTGASWSQVVCFAVFPQAMPAIVSQSLLRLESNVRGATVLGVVGAGGIGQLLMDKFGAYRFQEVATMMIIIIIVVTAIDFACGRLLKRLA